MLFRPCVCLCGVCAVVPACCSLAGGWNWSQWSHEGHPQPVTMHCYDGVVACQQAHGMPPRGGGAIASNLPLAAPPLASDNGQWQTTTRMLHAALQDRSDALRACITHAFQPTPTTRSNDGGRHNSRQAKRQAHEGERQRDEASRRSDEEQRTANNATAARLRAPRRTTLAPL